MTNYKPWLLIMSIGWLAACGGGNSGEVGGSPQQVDMQAFVVDAMANTNETAEPQDINELVFVLDAEEINVEPLL